MTAVVDEPGPLRRHSRPPVPGRWAAILVALAVIVGVAVFEVASPPPGAAPPPVGTGGVGVSPAASVSSSAFCSAGTGSSAAVTIYLTNTTSQPVTGSMTTVGTSSGGPASRTRRTVTVPPLGTAAVNPALGMPAGSTASSFSFGGGGVSVDQVVAGPSGWSTAPCASEISGQWAFAGGSTTSGNALSLSLFDPAAPAAVVDVSFLTPKGLVTPQAYQGLAVPAGGLVVVNVGDYVQDVPTIGTLVTAVSGSVVSDELQQTTGAANGLALQLGSPQTATSWQFAHTVSPRGATVDFAVANPAATPVTATVSAGISAGSVVPKSFSVPPQSILVFDASTSGLPVATPYTATVTATGPVVVGRSVAAPPGSTPPTWGQSGGVATPAPRWLVPGPGVHGAPGVAGATVQSLAVADPGSAPARVVVAVLGGRVLATVTVAAGSVVVLPSAVVGGLRVLTVFSSQPVVVEADSGPSGSPGVVSSSGFPWGSGPSGG